MQYCQMSCSFQVFATQYVEMKWKIERKQAVIGWTGNFEGSGDKG